MLSEENKKQLWIPEGFAHGFLTLSETAECLYKTTNYYAPNSEHSIHWNDQLLVIDWSIPIQKISLKDQETFSLLAAEVFT